MRLRVFTALLLVAAPAFGQEVGDRVVRVSGEDREMSEAIAKARSTLDQFLTLAKRPPRGSHDFKLKVMFSDQNGVEHMWVTPFKVNGDEFTGTLADEPGTVQSVRAWQTVKFNRSDITDWGYEQGGEQIGSFTVCVLLKHMAPSQAEQYRSYGFRCQA